MTDIATLGIRVDSKDLTKGTKGLKRLERQGKKSEKVTAKLGKSFSRMGAAAGIAVAAIGAGLFVAAIKNTIEQERVVAQLNQTLKSTGRFSQEASDGLQAYAAELQKVSTFGDEAVIASTSLLLTFTKIGEDTLPRAQQSVLDVATAMGTDLKSAAIQVGKALNDPKEGLSALSRSGITFSESQKEVIRALAAAGDMAGAQSLILKELETQFGGSAEAARNTLGGALKSLQNSFGDLLEAEKGSPDAATASINDLIDTLNDPAIKEGFQSLTGGMLSIVNVSAKAIAGIAGFGEAIGIAIAQARVGVILDNVKDINKAIAATDSKLTTLNREIDKPRLLRINPFASDEDLDKEFSALVNKLRDLKSLKEQVANAGVIPSISSGNNNGNKPKTKQEGDNGGAVDTEALDLFRNESRALLDDLINAEMGEFFSQQEAISNSFSSITTSLSDQRTMLGMTERAAFVYQAQLRLSAGATDDMKDSVASLAGALFDEKSELDAINLKAGDNVEALHLMRDAATEWSRTFADALVDGNSSFESFANGILKQLQKIALEKAFAPIFGKFGGFLDTAIGSIGSSISGAFAGGAISGGTAITGSGLAGAASPINLSRSFDGGGFTGNGSRSGGVDGKGGFPAILHPNETVTDHTKGGGKGSVTVVVKVDASGSSATGDQDGQAIGQLIGVAVRSVLIDEKRPGGLLT